MRNDSDMEPQCALLTINKIKNKASIAEHRRLDDWPNYHNKSKKIMLERLERENRNVLSINIYKIV